MEETWKELSKIEEGSENYVSILDLFLKRRPCTISSSSSWVFKRWSMYYTAVNKF
jgi:hypothetical protein